MFHWYYRWQYLRRSRRRSRELSEERYPKRRPEPGNIFMHSTIQSADDDRSMRSKAIRRRIKIAVFAIACIGLAWFLWETAGAIGIFSG